jgi:hypothetical protein
MLFSLLVYTIMEIMCFGCNGSGWKNHYPFGLTIAKPIFIYIPCTECKGKGFVQLPDLKENKDGKD